MRQVSKDGLISSHRNIRQPCQSQPIYELSPYRAGRKIAHFIVECSSVIQAREEMVKWQKRRNLNTNFNISGAVELFYIVVWGKNN